LTDHWRIYFDHDSSWRAVEKALTRRGVDCVTSIAVGMDRATDEQQLAFATRENRILLTSNQGDFTRLHRNYLNAGITHAGIVIVPQHMQIGQRLRRLERLRATISPDEMRDHIAYLGNFSD
jgi:hypothetical protein